MYIVTGGAGFIGSALVWRLNQAGIDDIVIVDDLGDEAADHPAENVMLGAGKFRLQFGFGSHQISLCRKLLPPFFIGLLKNMGEDGGGLFTERLFELF